MPFEMPLVEATGWRDGSAKRWLIVTRHGDKSCDGVKSKVLNLGVNSFSKLWTGFGIGTGFEPEFEALFSGTVLVPKVGGGMGCSG